MATIEQKEIWNQKYKSRRQKLIDEYGLEYVKNLEKERKRVQRAKNQKQEEPSKLDIEKLLDDMTDGIKAYTKKVIEKSNDNKIIKVKSDIPKVIKQKQLLNIKSIDSMEEFVKLLSKDTLKNKDESIKEKSLYQYANNLRKIYKMMTNKELNFNDLSFLEKYDEIEKFLIDKYGIESNTIGTYVNSITSILGRLSGYEELYKKYGDLNKKFKAQNDNRVGESVLSEKEQKNYVNYGELLSFQPNDNPMDELIYAIYVHLPPRRNEDYQKMIVCNKKDIDKYEDANFYTPSTKQFIFKKYKTHKTYGDYIIDLNTKDTKFIKYSLVRDAITKYIKDNKIKNGEYLFSSSTSGSELKNFTQTINRAFKIDKKKIGVNVLRHSFISNFLKSNPPYNDKLFISRVMGHDVNTQSVYNKLD